MVANVLLGLLAVEEEPSPKLQEKVLPTPVDVLLNPIVKFVVQLVLPVVVNAATGFATTVTFCVVVSLQPLPLLAINLTANVPVVEYVLVGLKIEEVFPSPKFHE